MMLCRLQSGNMMLPHFKLLSFNLFWLCAESECGWCWFHQRIIFLEKWFKPSFKMEHLNLFLEESYCYYNQHYLSRHEFPPALAWSCPGLFGCNNSQNVVYCGLCVNLVGGASVIGNILQAAQQSRMAIRTNSFGWRLLLQRNTSLPGGGLPSPYHAVDLLEALGGSEDTDQFRLF